MTTATAPSTGIIVRDNRALPPEIDKMRLEVVAMNADIQRVMVGYEKHVELLTTGILGGGNAFLFGAHGLGKTMLGLQFAMRLYDPDEEEYDMEAYLAEIAKYEPRSIGKVISQPGFYYNVFGPMSELEEVFGAHNFGALDANHYIRSRRQSIVTAFVAVLDEFFESNSGLRKEMRGLLGETPIYTEDGVTYELSRPLLFIVASNSRPGELANSPDYDRFPIKLGVGKLPEREQRKEILLRHDAAQTGALDTSPQVRVSIETIKALRAWGRRNIYLPDGIIELLQTLDDTLEGGVEEQDDQGRGRTIKKSIRVSPRTLNRCIDALKAHALLKGRAGVTNADMSILPYIVADPDDQGWVRALVQDLTAPREKEAEFIYHEIGRDAGKWLALAQSHDRTKKEKAYSQAQADFKTIVARLGQKDSVYKKDEPTLYGIYNIAEKEGYDVEVLGDMVAQAEQMMTNLAAQRRQLSRDLGRPEV